MSRFTFPIDSDSEAYCLETAQYMVVNFGISEEDAISRINEQWQHTTLVGDNVLLFHYLPDYWAKFIYYGGNDWSNGDQRLYNALSKLERKVDLALDHLGIEYGIPSHRVLRMLEQGQLAQASWLYRDEAIGSGTDALRILKAMQTQAGQNRGAVP